MGCENEVLERKNLGNYTFGIFLIIFVLRFSNYAPHGEIELPQT